MSADRVAALSARVRGRFLRWLFPYELTKCLAYWARRSDPHCWVRSEPYEVHHVGVAHIKARDVWGVRNNLHTGFREA